MPWDSGLVSMALSQRADEEHLGGGPSCAVSPSASRSECWSIFRQYYCPYGDPVRVFYWAAVVVTFSGERWGEAVWGQVILIALPFVTLGLPVGTIAQHGATPSGHRYVMKIEIEKVADAGGEEASSMFATVGETLRHTLLPDGVVEASITTDGRSVGSELRGRVLAMPSGTVVLTRAGDANDGYVLDPAAKTYYTVKPAAMNMPDP